MAARLGAYFQTPARWWLMMQAEYDADRVEGETALVSEVTPLALDQEVFLTPAGVLWLGKPGEEAQDERRVIPMEAFADVKEADAEPSPRRVVRVVQYPNGAAALVGEDP